MTATAPACDAGMALACGGAQPPAHPRLLLLVCILASSLAFVDGSVVNVGLPAIGRDLHAGAADLQWIINAYLLPLSALLLLGGALGDRFGRRRLLLAGVALFAAGSAACALAPALPWLLAARAAQGLGAALLLPSSLGILGGAFEGARRSRAVGTWAAASAIAGAIGPVLGGALTDSVGWRSIFLVNLPLAAGAVGLALYAVPEQRPQGQGGRLDLAGGLLATGALACLTWGLTSASGPHGWSPAAGGALGAGVLLGALFGWRERQAGDEAMTPLALFGARPLVGLNLLTLLLYGALSGFLLLLPYRLIRGSGYSATAAGAALLPFPLLMSLASPVMGAVAGKIGPRLPLAIGPLVVAAGLALACRIGPSGDYWTQVLPSVLTVAVGMALAAAPLTAAVLASVDARHTGSASGFNSAVARAGGLVATALLGAVLATQGQALASGFRLAALAGAGMAVAAAASAFLLLGAARR